MTTTQSSPRSDALVFFGATGDLAYKKVFPALQALVRRACLGMPIIGVALSHWDLQQFKEHIKQSLKEHGLFDPETFTKLTSQLRYIDGDYNEASTFTALRAALGSSKAPLFYLAIPPSMFSTVVAHLANSGCSANARIIIEKPFGRDLASAKALNKTLLKHFPETSIFRIDHYLGKEPVQNLVYFRFANPIVEVGWGRASIDSIEITMAESFGVAGRGKFYEEAGAIRDVLQNHMLQRDERAQVHKAIRTLGPAEVVRGQFRGYRRVAGVASDSKVETFAAACFYIDNERWFGVPFYVRVGKNLPVTVTEVLVRFKCPQHGVFSHCSPLLANYYRLRISPEVLIAIGLRAKKSGAHFEGENIELLAHHESKDDMNPYARLLSDAANGDASLFARQDAVEESWRVVDKILGNITPLFEYEPGTWGPNELVETLAPKGGWHDPTPGARGEAP
jgi:glucose-6-phosphate 1-dehydrogenase